MTKVIASYKPLAWQLAPLRDKSPVILLTGSAGGGKSRCAAEKIHAYMLHYPGARGLLVRKAREFASKSMVMALKRAIGSPEVASYNKSELMFTYANGSMIAVAGVKDDTQREALRSIFEDGGVDIVWIEEANAVTYEAFQEIRTRMRGRAASWRQIILTTNPDSPNHWINQRLIVGGEAAVYYSRAADNPHNPPDYLDTLESLTGVQRERLVLGRWVQAEGVVYDNFDLETHVTDAAEYNPDLPVYWGVDDGYAHGQGPGTPGYHPRVIVFANLCADGSVNVFDEIVMTGQLPEQTLKDALEREYRRPHLVSVDSSASELRRRLSDARIRNLGATHVVTEGIKVVRRFLGDGKGVSSLRIHPRCRTVITEMQSYTYDTRSTATASGERKPMKHNDHALDALRYMLWYWR